MRKKTIPIWSILIAALMANSASLGWCEPVRIAILDSGSALYVDEAKSFTPFPADEDPLDHGTIVAGIIREQNPNAFIAMLQVMEERNGRLKPSHKAVREAVHWCIQNEIDLVNLSLVISYDKDIEEIIRQAAGEYGIRFIAASGNKSLSDHFATNKFGFVTHAPQNDLPRFPASHPSVISVGALDEWGEISQYAGKFCDIYTFGEASGHDGTSFACARVTAEAARILKISPRAEKEEILTLLKNRL